MAETAGLIEHTLRVAPGLDVPDEALNPSQQRRSFMAGGYVMVGRPLCKRLSTMDGAFSQWQRIALYAYSRSRQDAHCPLGDRELATALGKPKMRNDKLKDEIDKAIDHGLLAPGSNRGCLILPFEVRYLTTNDIHSRCTLH